MRRTGRAEASPQLVLGEAAPERFTIRENGVQFELSFGEGYSVGLFLDQRDNRRRLLTRHVASDFPLLQFGDRRSAMGTPQHLRLYLRLFAVRGESGSTDDQPRSLEEMARLGQAQFRAQPTGSGQPRVPPWGSV